MSLLKKKDTDVVDVTRNAASVSFEFNVLFVVALAIGLEGAVSGGAGHHARAAFVYGIATYVAVLAFGYYYFRIFTNRHEAYRTAYVLLHLPAFLCIVATFIWAMIEHIMEA